MDIEKNIVDNKKYKESRKELEKFFKKKMLGEAKAHFSESGNYVLTIQQYETKKGCWKYSRGIVENKDGESIADIKRNYSSFEFLFVVHPNGKEYLVCGEDYQGYTIINLTDKVIKTYVPEGWLKGAGFCWIDYKFNEDDQQLIVNGCYWAFPYETVTYDFSNPDELPFKELNRKDKDIDEDDE